MFWKKKKHCSVFSICDGQLVNLSEVPDPVFSEKILGDGVAIIPESSDIVAPVSGKIVQVFDTKHAYSILSDDGLEILVHIGLNTVELNGKGFEAIVKEGDVVKVGDKIAEVNIVCIESLGYQLYTPVIITNYNDIEIKNVQYKSVKKGEEIISYVKK